MAARERFSKYPHRADRRRFLKVLGGTGVAGALTSLGRAESSPEPFPWQVGAAVAEITPPLDVGLLMSSGRELWEPFEGVRLPICARAMVVEREGKRLAIVALDLLGLAGEAVGGMRGFKQQVAKAAGSLVQPDALILSSTHTHCAPESAALTDLYLTPAFKAWSEHLIRRIGGAVRSSGCRRPVPADDGDSPRAGNGS